MIFFDVDAAVLDWLDRDEDLQELAPGGFRVGIGAVVSCGGLLSSSVRCAA
ncbi:hypothetical protein [Bradyrhizobium sp. JYMT SZCCT0428]|uniref:hypothetical protein n=1 Tax=Bradyrhizobium sp. JYMT SZCCT0428 TaxID=2807673 RepID=UPI001BA54C12|nr:hypothetical protein [Bradyrhizobium sp. JYMT SZCCT0428]